MENLHNDKILEFRPDTLEAVKKDVNLDKRGIDEAIDLLQDWLKKQMHFAKKDFTREYLEIALVSNKGSVERTKQRIDKLCTFKTLMPEFFEVKDPKEFESLSRYITTALLPKLTPEQFRPALLRFIRDDLDSKLMLTFFKFAALHAEYLKKKEYNSGFVITLDCRNINPLNLATSMSPLELRKGFTLIVEGYGMRIKSIHLITGSKVVDALVMLLKKLVSPKLGDRIHIHKTIDTCYEYVPKELFPIDYGGEMRSLKELHDEWMNLMVAEENMEYFREMKNAATIESYRQENQFNENYAGMPGSFRTLSVD